ncbi:hypothetical protein BR10RB9215_C20628 [Brucella sp. 10RB9215]|uniref:AAA family ATPase n=1 Tax=Brucella sp. 10RB9215 TaxID=1149953 RepID=UPI00090B15F1|nr:ATP-binding protein [Brucella sp. 10RB9215]SBW15960.1 hypothetical protein BR10RB9215_C20628 [Brucella sp. 10RB9215]
MLPGFAREYQPCVIFAEDIDRAADREDEDVNDLVNMLDGLISKEMEMMVVLTTNHIEKIDRALLRPGRFDAVISIDAPDAETAERIIRVYAGKLLSSEADLAPVGEVVAGMIPASIREVVERAKLSMLTEGRNSLTVEDLRISAIGMKRHVALLEPKKAEKTPAEQFADGLIGLIGDKLSASEGVAQESSLHKIARGLAGQLNNTNKKIEVVNMRATMAAGAADKAADSASLAFKVANEAASHAKQASEKADVILNEVS